MGNWYAATKKDISVLFGVEAVVSSGGSHGGAPGATGDRVSPRELQPKYYEFAAEAGAEIAIGDMYFGESDVVRTATFYGSGLRSKNAAWTLFVSLARVKRVDFVFFFGGFECVGDDGTRFTIPEEFTFFKCVNYSDKRQCNVYVNTESEWVGVPDSTVLTLAEIDESGVMYHMSLDFAHRNGGKLVKALMMAFVRDRDESGVSGLSENVD